MALLAGEVGSPAHLQQVTRLGGVSTGESGERQDDQFLGCFVGRGPLVFQVLGWLAPQGFEPIQAVGVGDVDQVVRQALLVGEGRPPGLLPDLQSTHAFGIEQAV